MSAGLSRVWTEGVQGGMAPCCRAQTAASAQRGSAGLVPRVAEGDTAANAGRLKLLPCPALFRTDVTSEGSSMPYWQGMKLDQEPVARERFLLAGARSLCWQKGLVLRLPFRATAELASPSAAQTGQSSLSPPRRARLRPPDSDSLLRQLSWSAVSRHVLCARHWVRFFLRCPMPGPKASPEAACPAAGQSASISDFNPHPGLGLQAGWAVFPGTARTELPTGSGNPWHTD